MFRKGVGMKLNTYKCEIFYEINK